MTIKEPPPSYTVTDALDGLPDKPIARTPIKPRTHTANFRIWMGAGDKAAFRNYTTQISPGMVVLDVIHQIQAEQQPDLACRWNCKAGKCGSCSAEVNGKPRLM